LATQGWENVNSLSPEFTGVPQSGAVFSANPSTGQQQVVKVNPVTGAITTGKTSGGTVVLGILAIGVLWMAFGGGGKAHASATVTHANRRYRRNRRLRSHRRRRRHRRGRR
jgi:hypothetical protein